ncbi:hypothetical protein [Haloglomus halophilum]|uniref:hypothetical protein n=1 Tax=Haloglomus halophilum TaxID=2962672 RepID=UPI0020CA029E|nr:hypothetical protein [Haloglomus halophilum]
MRRTTTVSTFVDPDADETECHEFGEMIQIADDELVFDAIVRHYQNVHDMLTGDGE